LARRNSIHTRRTVIRKLKLDGQVLDRLEELQIVVAVRRKGKERAYRSVDVDRLRVYQVLVQELGVNPAGAEIILRMRDQLLLFRKRMGQVLSQIKAEGMLDDFSEILSSLDKEPW
jgi:MerR family transcriptional regulator, heat shock protein HspR